MAGIAAGEPDFALSESTPRSSKTTFIISGIKCYVYGLGELQNYKNNTPNKQNVACLFLAHGRMGTYHDTEDVAHEILWRYRNNNAGREKGEANPHLGSIPLIAATFDMRNHGEREIDQINNLAWTDGNENHAFDMISLINGSAQDLQLLIELLPCYVPRLCIARNYVFGISLGAHTAWRLTRLFEKSSGPKVDGVAPVIGSPDLTGLLLSRLGIDIKALKQSSQVDKAYELSYDVLKAVMSEQQRLRWPEVLHNYVTDDDRWLDTTMPLAKLMYDAEPSRGNRLLLQNGADDKLVPSSFTETWVKAHGGAKDKSQGGVWFIVQENTGHTCTKEMVARVADWLSELTNK